MNLVMAQLTTDFSVAQCRIIEAQNPKGERIEFWHKKRFYRTNGASLWPEPQISLVPGPKPYFFNLNLKKNRASLSSNTCSLFLISWNFIDWFQNYQFLDPECKNQPMISFSVRKVTVISYGTFEKQCFMMPPNFHGMLTRWLWISGDYLNQFHADVAAISSPTEWVTWL